MLSLKKVGANTYAVSVMSLEYVETVLRLAGDKKLLELRSCLEGIEKTNNLSFRPGPTQTELYYDYMHRRWLEAGNFVFKKKRDYSINK